MEGSATTLRLEFQFVTRFVLLVCVLFRMPATGMILAGGFARLQGGLGKKYGVRRNTPNGQCLLWMNKPPPIHRSVPSSGESPKKRRPIHQLRVLPEGFPFSSSRLVALAGGGLHRAAGAGVASAAEAGDPAPAGSMPLSGRSIRYVRQVVCKQLVRQPIERRLITMVSGLVR